MNFVKKKQLLNRIRIFLMVKFPDRKLPMRKELVFFIIFCVFGTQN